MGLEDAAIKAATHITIEIGFRDMAQPQVRTWRSVTSLSMVVTHIASGNIQHG
jgi:hypothetical protein